jgi:RNA 2',3'-cyclic 3'-phosphodiesterase
MRLFVAVELDAAALEAIAEVQQRLKAALSNQRGSMRWTQADHMHLTLAFLGEVPDDRAAVIVDAAGRPIDQPPFAITFQGLGVFPSHGPPRVLWIGVGEGADELAMLRRTIAARVASCGVALEDRAFHPHLTLGRWRDAARSDRRAALAAFGPGAVARLAVSDATLYRSRLSQTGAEYAPLARATLSDNR